MHTSWHRKKAIFSLQKDGGNMLVDSIHSICSVPLEVNQEIEPSGESFVFWAPPQPSCLKAPRNEKRKKNHSRDCHSISQYSPLDTRIRTGQQGRDRFLMAYKENHCASSEWHNQAGERVGWQAWNVNRLWSVMVGMQNERVGSVILSAWHEEMWT